LFHAPSSPQIYTLSLHDALPIYRRIEALRLAEVYRARVVDATIGSFVFEVTGTITKIDKFVELMGEVGLVEVARTGIAAISRGRSEEHTSELQSRRDLVCRLLLE